MGSPRGERPLRVEVIAPTQLALALEPRLTGARLRAELRSRGVLLPSGQFSFSLNGVATGVANVQSEVASFELSSLAPGNYLVEARFQGGNGYTASRAEAAFQLRNQISLRQTTSNSIEIAPSSLASIYGTNLATATVANTAAELPTTLAGVSVTIEDSQRSRLPARLTFVSPTQINLLVPEGLADGTGIVTVTRNGQKSGQGTIELRSVAPGIFTMNGNRLPAGLVIWRTADGQVRNRNVFDCSTTYREDEVTLEPDTVEAVLTLFGTGWRNSREGILARISGANARVVYAGPQNSFPGLDQINIQLDVNRRGRLVIDIIADGHPMNQVEILLR